MSDRCWEPPAYMPAGVEPERLKAWLDELLAVCSDHVFIYDVQARYCYVSDQIPSLASGDPLALLGQTWRDLGYPGEVIAPFEALVARVIATGETVMDECEVRSSGKSTLYAYKYAPLHGTDGTVVAVVAGVRDITAARLAEQALRDSEGKWRSLVYNAPGIIVTADRDGRVTFANRSVIRTDVDDAIGVDILSSLSPDEATRVRAIHNRVLETGEPASYVTQAPGAGGGRAWYQTNVAAVKDGETIVGLIVIATDVTVSRQVAEDLAAREEALRQADGLARMKNHFVSAVSHELRTPLTSIKGFAEFLEDGIEGPLTAGQLGFVTQIQSATSRLERLVDDLLDFARIDAGTFYLKKHEVDLAETIREVTTSVAPQVLDAGLTLSVPNLPPMPMVVDSERIAQVIANLLSNAIKFTPQGGAIDVGVRLEDDIFHFEVRDTGPGIAADDLPKLFQRFSQLSVGNIHRSGAGLGLSISKALVEAHAGKIGVESVPGNGAKFWFTLPTRPPV